MKNITIIVPVHVFEEKLLSKALSSITDKNSDVYTLLFVGPKDVCTKSEKLAKKLGIKFNMISVINEDTDFVSQINKAVYSCITPYFTILEFDDEFTDIYFNVMQKYADEHPELSIILPINEYYNSEGKMLSFGNEIALDASFTENIGVIGLEELEIYMDFNCTGGLIKTEDFISVGGLKKSLKIATWYEFLLRCVYKEKGIYVIPKICYKHTVGRADSFMVKSQEEIKADEGKFLIETAKQEYFFKEDRNKVFGQENKEE